MAENTKVKTLQHPVFPDVTRDVPEPQVKAWREAGWVPVTTKQAQQGQVDGK